MPPRRSAFTDRSRLAAAFAAIVGIGLLCYAHTLDVPWYLDDFHFIVDNPTLRDLGAALDGALGLRGLTALTFALNVALSGYSLAAFHLTNIAIHLVAGCLALLVLRHVFPARLDLALLGALLFIAHPVQTQAVTYVVQRLASLSGLLCLAAVWLYLVARDRRSEARVVVPYLGSLACGAAAMLVKESAATLPLLLLLGELLLPTPGPPPRPAWRRLVWTLPFLVVPGYFALRALGPLGLTGSGASAPVAFELDVVGDGASGSRLAYLSTELTVLWRYLGLIVWPVRQVFDLGLTISPEPLRPAVILAGAGLAAVLAGALAVWRRAPIVTFGVLWFFAALSVESTLIPLDPYYEHRLYLPLLGPIVVFTALLDHVLSDRRRIALAGLAIVAVLAALTVRRNQQWRDPAVLWATDLAHGSLSYRSAIGLADAFYTRGEEAAARRVYEEFLAASGERCRGGGCGARLLLNLGVIAERLGDLPLALDYYTRAVEIDASYARAHFGLGVVHYRQDRKAEALRAFRTAKLLAPGDTLALYNYCSVALELGDPEPALESLARIRGFDPKLAAQLEAQLTRAGHRSPVHP